MKPTPFNLAATLMLLLALTACQSEELSNGRELHNPDAPIEFPLSRTTIETGDDELTTVFKDGTEIGITMQDYPEYSNVKYKYQQSTNSFIPAEPGKGIYFGEKELEGEAGDIVYYANYPYSSNGDYGTLAVKADQSSAEGYYTSDLLQYRGKIGSPLQFQHLMAKILIRLPQEATVVRIMDMPLDWQGGTRDDITAFPSEDGRSFRAFVQSGSQPVRIEIESNGMTYEADFGEKDLETGKQYTFTVETLIPVHPDRMVDLGSVNTRKTITDNENWYVYQADPSTPISQYIEVKNEASPTIYLNRLNVEVADGPTIDILSGSPKIVLMNENRMKAKASWSGILNAISLRNENANVEICGNGHLYIEVEQAGGYEDGNSAIGPRLGHQCGNITIRNCTITAKPGKRAAVIGTGGGAASNRVRKCGNILIENATIHAIPYDEGQGWSQAAVIGTGYAHTNFNYTAFSELACGHIIVKGSIVTGCKEGEIIVGAGKCDDRSSNSCGDVSIDNSSFRGRDSDAEVADFLIGKYDQDNSQCGNITVNAGEKKPNQAYTWQMEDNRTPRMPWATTRATARQDAATAIAIQVHRHTPEQGPLQLP